MNILKREVAPTSTRMPWFLCMMAIVALMTYAAGLRDGLVLGMSTDKPLASAMTSLDIDGMPATIVTIMPTIVSDVSCKDIMERYEAMPIEQMLDNQGLLDQVGDCTLQALEEPSCGISDPIGCVELIWNKIVH